jgi:hypothetical protein
MTNEIEIEIEGEVQPKSTTALLPRIDKKITDLTTDESEKIKADILAGVIYENIDLKQYKNGNSKLIYKKKDSKTVNINTFEQKENVQESKAKKTYMTDSQFLMQELLRMQESMVTEKLKRKKLKKRFTELDELFNIMEDTDVVKPASEQVVE